MCSVAPTQEAVVLELLMVPSWGHGLLSDENKQILRKYTYSFPSHLLPRIGSPLCMVRFFLPSSHGMNLLRLRGSQRKT